jgi:pyruvate dehydrogenase E2 component (dihydrolipoamide acetyltransferase)
MSVETTPAGVPLKGIRRTIARRMTQAWQVPVFHLTIAVDMEPAGRRRAQLPGASLTDVLLRDCATALERHPELNAHFADEAITAFERQNLGLAVATERGVVVPVIQDVGSLSDAALVQERRRMVGVARGGVMRPEDFAGGTFTISNLGMYGIESFDAILNTPQVAILAVGATEARLELDSDGAVRSRSVAKLTLTCDHRATDGAIAAGFLQTLRAELERS